MLNSLLELCKYDYQIQKYHQRKCFYIINNFMYAKYLGRLIEVKILNSNGEQMTSPWGFWCKNTLNRC